MSTHVHCRLLGLAVAMIVTSCGVRDQYDKGSVPQNPDQQGSALVPTITPPRDDSNAGPGNGGGLTGSAQGQTAEEVTAVISSWHNEPIVWNQSAGQIEIGKTNYNKWWDEVLRLYNISPFQLFFAPPDGAYNLAFQGTELVASTVSGVNVSIGYKGRLELTAPEGQKISVALGESVVEKGLFTAQKDGSDLNQAAPDTSTRGREFFKRFYNEVIRQDEGGEDPNFDCFAAGFCRYFIVPTNEFYALIYTSPRSESGYLYLSRENNVLTSLSFTRPELPSAQALSAPEIAFDVLSGSFGDNEGKQLLSLGDSFAKYQDLKLPDSTFIPQSDSIAVRYQGLTFSFARQNFDRLADTSYVEPESKDYYNSVSINYVYSQPVYLAFETAEPLVLTMNDQARIGWTRSQHLSFLQSIADTLAADLEASGGKLLYSEIQGASSIRQDARYSLFASFEKGGQTRRISISSSRKSAYLNVSSSLLYQSEANSLQLTEQVDPQSGALIRSFGEFTAGSYLNLKDIDLIYRDQATLISESGSELRVSITRDQLSKRKYINKDGLVSSLDENVYSFTINDLVVSFKVTPCRDRAGTCYEVVALEAYSFYQPASETLGGGQVQLCGKTVSLGMKRKEFESLMAGISGCPLVTDESEVGQAVKSRYYIPAENVLIAFGDEEGSVLESVTSYLNGN